MMKIEKLLLMGQAELFSYIKTKYSSLVTVSEKGKYIIINYVEDTPLLCSHLDTVNGNYNLSYLDIISSNNTIKLRPTSTARCLGADDRAGVYIMLRLLDDMLEDKIARDRYSFGFFCDEEIGGIGSSYYLNSDHFKDNKYSCFIGLDRRNAVVGVPEVATYGCDNNDLIDKFLDIGYKESMGSFTDASNLANSCDIACVNLSVGYNNEHTKNEYLTISDMLHTYYKLKDSSLVFDKEYKYESYYDYKKKNTIWYGYGLDGDFDVTEPIVCDYCGVHEKLYRTYDYVLGEEVEVCESCYRQLMNDFNLDIKV